MAPRRVPPSDRTRRRGPAPPDPGPERDALLDAGLAVMAEVGVGNLNLNDVLVGAGVSTRAFYRHFSSKDEFLVAMWGRESQRAVVRLQARVERAGPGFAAVAAWIDERVERVFAPPRDTGYQALWRDGFWIRNAYPHQFGSVIQPQIDVLRRVVADAVADGSMPDAHPDLDAATIYATFWMLADRRFRGEPITRAQARTHLLRMAAALLHAGPVEPGLDAAVPAGLARSR